MKKSESLEIRLPHPTKQAFMARCQAQGRSASEALRGFIEAELAPPPRPKRRLRYLVVAGLAAAGLGAAAAPSLAGPADAALTRAEFHRLDANGDGVLSMAEFTGSAGRTDHP